MRQRFFQNARRIVVKVGTSVLESSGELDDRIVDRLARDVARVKAERKCEIVLVSSGAIASGMRLMGLKKRPADLEKLQALAAIGQRSLMQVYDSAFRKEDMTTAQILLTWDDLGLRKRYESTRKTVAQILAYGAVPIINENDTVATEEIRFGDNDRLSAMVALLIDADLLVILSDSDGLYADYAAGKSSRIPVVDDMNASVFDAVRDSKKAFSKGGMASKLQAVDKAVSADIPVALADGKAERVLSRLMAGEDLGTLFLPKMKKKSSKKRWISYVSKPNGTVVVDGGAEDAILKKGKSLLATGIVRVKGHFGAGDTVAVVSAENRALGNGIVNFSSAELDKIRGVNSKKWDEVLGRPCMDEVIHRDNFGAV